MIAVIHQPYFLPWLGYFSKLIYADFIVFLDNVNFTKGFYLDRTKYVNMAGEIKYLNVPIGQHPYETLNEIQIIDKSFIDKLFKSIEFSYARAKHYKATWPDLKEIIKTAIIKHKFLVDTNIDIIKSIMDYLDLKQPTYFKASQFHTTNDRTQRIIELCQLIKADSILIGTGSSLKHHDWNLISRNNITIYLQDFMTFHPVYRQVRRQKMSFEKGLSVLDCILNNGKFDTKLIIENITYKPIKFNIAYEGSTSNLI